MPRVSLIYHLTTAEDWTRAQQDGAYTHPSLSDEGFIHASTPAQIAATANRFYGGRSDLILLHIDTDKIGAPLKWELAPSIGEEFPHIYGALNPGAVIATRPYLPGADGTFISPD